MEGRKVDFYDIPVLISLKMWLNEGFWDEEIVQDYVAESIQIIQASWKAERVSLLWS